MTAPPQTVTEEPTDPSVRRGRGVLAVVFIAILLFLAGGAGGSFQGKLAEVQKNDNAAYLPGSAESTKVANESAKFLKIESIPGFVVFNRTGGLTGADKDVVTRAFTAIQTLPGVDRRAMTPPLYAADMTVASIYTPLIAKQNGATLNGDVLAKNEKRIIDTAKAQLPAGLAAHPAGPGGLLVAFIDAFSGLDSSLIFAAGAVVIVILLVVYRSPVLWLFPLISDPGARRDAEIRHQAGHPARPGRYRWCYHLGRRDLGRRGPRGHLHRARGTAAGVPR
ncbi:MAG: putative drug exporter of the superfamily, partial [Pseudonocardiales bacterium]|nr:putative drug exporter of the superfamily [Pseudonocardiales bacterium]